MRVQIPTPGSGLFFPFLIAVGCHLLGALVLWFGWQQSVVLSAERLPPRINPEDIISATAVQNDPIEALRQKQQAEAAARAKALAERKKQQQLEAQRKEEARRQALIRQKQEEERQKEQERKRQEAARKREAERKAAAEAKRQAELKRQQQLKEEQARKAAEAERKRKAEQAEAKKKADEAERRRQEALAAEQRSLQAALEQEEAFLSQLEDREQLASMQLLIKSYVEQNWSRPPTARKGMQAILRIELLPTGEVKSVTVVESSNDSAFDRSAEQAVYRAGPFRELQDLKPHQRDAFRAFNLVFKPEDIQ